MVDESERRAAPRVAAEGVMAVVQSPAATQAIRFTVLNMSRGGLCLVNGTTSTPLRAEEVVDVELWGFTRRIKARGVVIRHTRPQSPAEGVALKLYTFDNGDEDYYRSILDGQNSI